MLRVLTSLLLVTQNHALSESCSSEPIGALVNVTAYPMLRDGQRGSEDSIAWARAALNTTGVASFPGFLTNEALASAVREAVQSSSSAWITDSTHNAWQTESNSSLPSQHIANLFMRTRVASIAYDNIGPTLRALYESPELLTFLSELLGKRLYRLADPLGACSINVFRTGWDHAWHFDEAEYTVTLSLQQAKEGGEFLFTPPLRRSSADHATEAVASVLRAETELVFELPGLATRELPAVPVHTAPFDPGTLQVFAGRYSLHAVKRTRGHPERLVAVLCFATEPGVMNSPAVQEMFWGRRAE